MNKTKTLVGIVSALLLTTVGIHSVLAAPNAIPPNGNVSPRFSAMTIEQNLFIGALMQPGGPMYNAYLASIQGALPTTGVIMSERMVAAENVTQKTTLTNGQFAERGALNIKSGAGNLQLRDADGGIKLELDGANGDISAPNGTIDVAQLKATTLTVPKLTPTEINANKAKVTDLEVYSNAQFYVTDAKFSGIVSAGKVTSRTQMVTNEIIPYDKPNVTIGDGTRGLSVNGNLTSRGKIGNFYTEFSGWQQITVNSGSSTTVTAKCKSSSHVVTGCLPRMFWDQKGMIPKGGMPYNNQCDLKFANDGASQQVNWVGVYAFCFDPSSN